MALKTNTFTCDHQLFLETLNYLFAVVGIALVFFVHRQRLVRLRARYQGWMSGGAA